MVREELNIHPAELAPLKDGVVTGTATAIGAFIPIVPFVVDGSHGPAVWVSLAISMLAHFAIGAARSLFTGRGIWASGRDMFVVGFGVAAVGYVIGELITRLHVTASALLAQRLRVGTTGQICSSFSSSLNAGIFGFLRPFETL